MNLRGVLLVVVLAVLALWGLASVRGSLYLNRAQFLMQQGATAAAPVPLEASGRARTSARGRFLDARLLAAQGRLEDALTALGDEAGAPENRVLRMLLLTADRRVAEARALAREFAAEFPEELPFDLRAAVGPVMRDLLAAEGSEFTGGGRVESLPKDGDAFLRAVAALSEGRWHARRGEWAPAAEAAERFLAWRAAPPELLFEAGVLRAVALAHGADFGAAERALDESGDAGRLAHAAADWTWGGGAGGVAAFAEVWAEAAAWRAARPVQQWFALQATLREADAERRETWLRRLHEDATAAGNDPFHRRVVAVAQEHLGDAPGAYRTYAELAEEQGDWASAIRAASLAGEDPAASLRRLLADVEGAVVLEVRDAVTTGGAMEPRGVLLTEGSVGWRAAASPADTYLVVLADGSRSGGVAPVVEASAGAARGEWYLSRDAPDLYVLHVSGGLPAGGTVRLDFSNARALPRSAEETRSVLIRLAALVPGAALSAP